MTTPMRAAIAVALLAYAGLEGLAHAQSRRPGTAWTPSAGRAVESAPSDLAGNHPTDRAGVAISGGVPALRGITPSRAELPASAFTKLDSNQRGYVTREDARQLDGFDAAFRAADQDGDGRLNASEFNAAWALYSGNSR
ncbi:MAG TPA: EF-hand domain-containing protein [Casimicrobiaceae bacterium]|nr:EF-hand domain-containing protein [Casimicrobiaceae bacterium]